MDFLVKQAKNDVRYGTFELFSRHGITHGFATRLGGVSDAPYQSLNLGLRTGDDTNKVIINRQRLCSAIGVDPSSVVRGLQIQGDRVAVVGKQDRGKGALGDDGLADTDSLITNLPDIPLMIHFADCVPLLFFDPVQKAVGACHAGWRGTAAKLAAKTVQTMQQNFGTNPADCLVGIGPSIGQCCFEISDDVFSVFKETFPYWKDIIKPHGQKWLLDLWQTNRLQLMAIGVHRDNIALSNACTACNTDSYFSYRAEHGKTGVLAAIITL